MADNHETPTEDATGEMNRRMKAVESQLQEMTDRLSTVENIVKKLGGDLNIFQGESQNASRKTVAMENQLTGVSTGLAMENEVDELAQEGEQLTNQFVATGTDQQHEASSAASENESVAITDTPIHQTKDVKNPTPQVDNPLIAVPEVPELQQVAEDSGKSPASAEQQSKEDSGGSEAINPAVTPPLDLQSLVRKCLAQEEANLTEDQHNLDGYNREAQNWTSQGKALLEGMQPTVQACNAILSSCKQVQASLPPKLQEKLQGRQEGLDLISKMLERLLGQAAGLAEDEPLESPLPSQPDLMALLTDETNEESARKVLDKQLKVIGNERWQLITKTRNSAQERRQRFLHFVEKRVLPVLDGLDNGEQNSKSLISQMKTDHPDLAESLTQWFETYSVLRQELMNLLNQVGVHLMEVKTVTPIDYERHEPFDVESDDTGLQDEDIKEVVRKGYEYALDSNTRTVLRAAQVIVVKN